LLSKFKLQTYRLPVKAEWIQYSLGTPEFNILEALVESDSDEWDDSYFIPLTKRFGIHPSENECCKEIYDKFKLTEKNFFSFLDKITEETGLTRVEILLRIPEDLNSLQVEVEKELKDSEDSSKLEIREKLVKIKNKLKTESKDIGREVAEYSAELKQISIAYEAEQLEYFFELISVFLSGKRCQKDVADPVFVSVEAIKNLHIDFQRALIDFLKSEIYGWEQEKEKESTEKN